MPENKQNESGVVGIIPAAGKATRLGRLPCSKEILPLGITGEAQDAHVVVLSDCLINEFLRAGISDIVFATAPAKIDIQTFYGDGDGRGAAISYIWVNSPNTPSTIAAALPALSGHDIAVGFPDVVYGEDDAFSKMQASLEDTQADVVLGLYPSRHPTMVDMVEQDASGRVTDICIKQADNARLKHCWLNAMWRDSFSRFLLENLKRLTERAMTQQRELYLGDIVRAALESGLIVEGVAISDSPCLDAGTPNTYAKALTEFAKNTA